MQPVVFLSYARKRPNTFDTDFDSVVCQRLYVWLKPVCLDLGFELFRDDKVLLAGDQVTAEIAAAIKRTAVGVLLLSPDFIDPDRYTRATEFPLLEARASAGEAVLVPVHVRECAYRRMSAALTETLFANDVASQSPSTRSTPRPSRRRSARSAGRSRLGSKRSLRPALRTRPCLSRRRW